MLESVTLAPPDPILGLTDAWRKDPNPDKVNLGVGVYMDDEGRTPVLKSVKAAERIILDTESTKSYMPIAGDPQYGRLVEELVFGAGSEVLASKRCQTAHTPGGTGGLRVGADFLREFWPGARVHVSNPTWANHKGIFAAAGFKIAEYPYYKPETKGVDFERLCEALKAVSKGEIVLLHVCCHNPSGADLSLDQWKEIAAIAKTAGWIPFLDFAYMGFGDGLVEDRQPLMPFAQHGVDMLIATSFSKNFGLYRERTGALTAVAASATAADNCISQIRKVVRVNYSNPCAHGGLIVTEILKSAELRAQWVAEVKDMCARIAQLRKQLVDKLKAQGVAQDFSFIMKQRGMFSFSGLTDAQVAFLKEKKSIYMVGGGRINVAGLTSRNMDYAVAGIAEALKQA